MHVKLGVRGNQSMKMRGSIGDILLENLLPRLTHATSVVVFGQLHDGEAAPGTIQY